MPRFHRIMQISAAPEVAWQRAGGFAGIARAMPPGAVELEGVGPGAIRRIRTPRGIITERCEAEDATSYVYVMESGPTPAKNYRARVSMRPEGAGSVVEWETTFDLPETEPEQAFMVAFEVTMDATLQRFKRALEG
jgi:Polyketide cyclase / dehydrase and lipid transport